MYLDILTKLLFIFFPFGFMIPCLQPDSASERASEQKKKKKLQVVFHTPQGPFLADRLVFCEPVTVQYLMRALCELAIASMLTAFT